MKAQVIPVGQSTKNSSLLNIFFIKSTRSGCMDLSCQHLEEKVGGLGVQGQPRSYENFSKKNHQIHYLKKEKQIKECSIL